MNNFEVWQGKNQLQKIEFLRNVSSLSLADQKEYLFLALQDESLMISEEARKLITLRRVEPVILSKDFVLKRLNDDDPKKQICAVKLIPLIADTYQQSLIIWDCYQSNNVQVKDSAKQLLSIVYNNCEDENIKRKIIKDVLPLNSFSLFSHPLYTRVDGNFFDKNKSFARHNFAKDGSKTIVLGGVFVGRIIIRIITLEAFDAWNLAYNSKQEWKDAGFKYIPIEPIIRYKKLRNGLVRVYCAVLDMTLRSLNNYVNYFQYLPILYSQKKKILDVLKKINVYHGHPHSANFCVVFDRTDGSINSKVCPELYLIDFDKSKIIK